jgi:hypothetical protein
MILAIFVLNLQLIQWSVNEWHRFANHPALPPPPPRVIPASKSRTWSSHFAAHVCGTGSRRGGGGGGVGSSLAGYTPNKEYSFLMISPKLLDFSPFFFLISSPLGTADFLVLLELSGDGYSLLCSKKQPPRHSKYISPHSIFSKCCPFKAPRPCWNGKFLSPHSSFFLSTRRICV